MSDVLVKRVGQDFISQWMPLGADGTHAPAVTPGWVFEVTVTDRAGRVLLTVPAVGLGQGVIRWGLTAAHTASLVGKYPALWALTGTPQPGHPVTIDSGQIFEE